jgi:hypothetical protein
MGDAFFKTWYWQPIFNSIPAGNTQVWLYQKIDETLTITDKDGKVIASFQGKKVDSISSPVDNRMAGFSDIQETDDFLRQLAPIAAGLAKRQGTACAKYTLSEKNTVELVSGGVELLVDGHWIADNGTDYHAHGSMINLPATIFLLGLPPKQRNSQVQDTRGVGTVLYGPRIWRLTVNGHFDQGAMVANDAHIDFSNLGPTAVRPKEGVTPQGVFNWTSPS